jgi:hypothetical protein
MIFRFTAELLSAEAAVFRRSSFYLFFVRCGWWLVVFGPFVIFLACAGFRSRPNPCFVRSGVAATRSLFFRDHFATEQYSVSRSKIYGATVRFFISCAAQFSAFRFHF